MHHIEIYVSDLPKTKKFYNKLLVENLNYKIYQEWENGVSYKQGEMYLVFVQVKEEKNDGSYNRTKVGLNHLAFRINSRSKLDQIRLLFLQDENINLLYDDRYPFVAGSGYYALFLEDPDRIKVEIVAEEVCM